MKLSLLQIAQWLSAGPDLPADEARHATGYSIDSRTLNPGDLFFAVKGEKFDGHDFVRAAVEKGAVAAVISREQAERVAGQKSGDELTVLQVPDTLFALQQLAAAVRRHWGKRLIGITGSMGKTTTKEAIAKVLSSQFNVLKSLGNLNNAYGLPLQLLKLEPEHEVAVIEMGMSFAGEIKLLAEIAKPNWGVVCNVAPVHIENFADGIAGVARAKYELLESLPADGVAFLNADDPYVAQFGRNYRGCTVYFDGVTGKGVCCDPRAEDVEELGAEGIRFTAVTTAECTDASLPEVRTEVKLKLLGRHSVTNALAAIAVGIASGMKPRDCAAALGGLSSLEKRGEVLQIGGATVINDCYNSNPRALEAMVDALCAITAKRRIVVAGEMLELGPDSSQLHMACGNCLARKGIDLALGVRGEAKHLVDSAQEGGVEALFVHTPEEAGMWLAEHLQPGDAVLLKGSRGVRLERALDYLKVAKGAAADRILSPGGK